MPTCEAHLQTLSLDQTATFEEIREAYQDLVMVWHPDRFMHNPRLYKKAEEKLKQFNQAYAYLKGQQTNAPHPTPQQSSSPSPPPPSAPSPPRSSAHSSTQHREPRRGIACPWLTFTDAEYIFSHYRFQPVTTKEAGYQTYQSGPFVLMTCHHPAEVFLSVPCDSLQTFDRILLSIPCKSQGRFCQTEAEQLLQLLQLQ
ncbi:MAG: J domain-containing protein [Acaryochloris sp. CRU_2_0]|nr:J domain-containing protein [Acaryochloris sp. CRU_2_0]